MERKDIEKAANEFADREYEYNDIDRDALYKGFYWGAQWRINSVWHDASEIPLPESRIFYEDTKGQVDVMLFFDGEQWDGFDDYGFEIVRWAYVKDLLPIKEDEE